MELSKRLTCIANLIPDNKIVTDVGSDHCYLLIYLALENRLQHGYAIENKSEPLILSQNNISNSHIKDKITIIFNNGIQNLAYTNDVIVMSGIGCSNICKILSENLAWWKSQKIILCPSDCAEIYVIREFLYKNSCQITNEILIKENDFFYIILEFNFNTTNKIIEFSEIDIYVGNFLTNIKNLEISEFLNSQLKIIEKSQNYNDSHHKKSIILTQLLNPIE